MPTENQSAAPAAQHPALELVNKPNLTTQETAHYLNRRPHQRTASMADATG